MATVADRSGNSPKQGLDAHKKTKLELTKEIAENTAP